LAKRTAQCRHLDAKVALFDVRVRPHPGDEIVLGDQRAGALDQDAENLERAAAQPQRTIAIEQRLLSGKKAVGAERDRLTSGRTRLMAPFDISRGTSAVEQRVLRKRACNFPTRPSWSESPAAPDRVCACYLRSRKQNSRRLAHPSRYSVSTSRRKPRRL